MEADASRLSALRCGKPASSAATASVLISQSGKSLVLTLGGGEKAAGLGVIEGRAIKASFVPPDSADSSAADCRSDRTLTLAATLDPKSDPRILSGTFSVDGCASCRPVEFRAVKQPRSSGEGAH
jgi:hypothetical protein